MGEVARQGVSSSWGFSLTCPGSGLMARPSPRTADLGRLRGRGHSETPLRLWSHVLAHPTHCVFVRPWSEKTTGINDDVLHMIWPKRELKPRMSREHVTWSKKEGLDAPRCFFYGRGGGLSKFPNPVPGIHEHQPSFFQDPRAIGTQKDKSGDSIPRYLCYVPISTCWRKFPKENSRLASLRV